MPRKPKLGQHFLTDLTARQRIVDALGDLSEATVIEIGPGQGAITDLLATRAHRLIAIELDREFAPALRVRFAAHPHVEVLEADILTVDLPTLLATSRPSPTDVIPSEAEEPLSSSSTTERSDGNAPIHIVGNLPYYITSDILLHLFRASLATVTPEAPSGVLSTAVLMVQREVAERVASPPGHRDFGRLSATAQMYAAANLLFTLGPRAFSPPPEVDSAVLRLRFHSRFAELGIAPAPFDRFLHQAFAQKRKTLAKNLRNAGYTPAQITAAWPPDLDPQVRAEATPLEQLAALHRTLALSRP